MFRVNVSLLHADLRFRFLPSSDPVSVSLLVDLNYLLPLTPSFSYSLIFVLSTENLGRHTRRFSALLIQSSEYMAFGSPPKDGADLLPRFSSRWRSQ